ncbi:MAG: AAA family ATPase [Patescibacteria group bacterium]
MLNSNQIIFAFIGEMLGGKGTACQYLQAKYGAPTYRFSTILRDIATRLRIEHSRANLQKISTALRQCLGENILAQAVANDVKADSSPLITVDGVRRLSDVAYIRELPGFHLIYVTADEAVRYQRVVARKENSDDGQTTLAQFQQDHLAESELGIATAAADAGFRIDNNGTLQEFYGKIEDILKQLGYGGQNPSA